MGYADYAARRWVRAMIARSPRQPLPSEAVWASLANEIGHGPLAVGRTRNLLAAIDRELATGGGAPLRGLQHAAARYLAREQESLKAS